MFNLLLLIVNIGFVSMPQNSFGRLRPLPEIMPFRPRQLTENYAIFRTKKLWPMISKDAGCWLK